MTIRWTWAFTLLYLTTLQTPAQEPIPLPIPDPAPTAVNDDALTIRPSGDTTVIEKAGGDDGADVDDTDFGSILLDPSAAAAGKIPLTAAPEIETIKPVIETGAGASKSNDGRRIKTTEPNPSKTFSSSIDGTDAPKPQSVIVEDPAKHRPVIQAPAANQPPNVPARVGTPRRDGRQTDPYSQPRRVPDPRRVDVQRVLPSQRRKMTTNETSPIPNAVAPATFEQPFRRLRPAVYRQDGILVIAPIGASDSALVPSPLRPYGFGGPRPIGISPLGYGGPRGPVGQIPQPRPFVPYQPVRNFIRGIGPY